MGYPVGVVVLVRSEFAFGNCVPELDFSVSTSRKDLSVIGRESSSEDFLGVSNESSGGLACAQVPKSQRFVPTGGNAETVIVRKRQTADEVVVSGQGSVRSSGQSVLFLFEESPNDKRVISRS